MRKITLFALAAVLLAACGSNVDQQTADVSPYDSYDDDSYDDSQADPEVLAAVYEEAYHGACDEVWDNSPDGDLYYGGISYTVDECDSTIGYYDGTDFVDSYDAEEQGRDDGFDGAFEYESELCWGDECWERYDF